jgi:hypothetical protein
MSVGGAMVFSKNHIIEMRRSRVSVNVLPALNFSLLLLVCAALAFYIVQINFISGSDGLLEKYRREVGAKGNKELTLRQQADTRWIGDVGQLKSKFGMVEVKSVAALRIDPDEVALAPTE